MKHANMTVTDPATGKVYPIPAGGADDSGQDADSSSQDGSGDDSGDGTDGGDTPKPDASDGSHDGFKSEESKDAVLRDLKAERTKRQKLEADLAAIKQQHETDQERAIREAREEAANEVRTEFATERLADRIRVAAAKKLNDPEDAVRLLDLDAFDASSDSLASEIEAQIGSLIESKPYLAVTSETPSGSTDAGSRTPPSKPGQLSRTDLSNMTPEDIDKARKDGRLNDLMGVKS